MGSQHEEFSILNEYLYDDTLFNEKNPSQTPTSTNINSSSLSLNRGFDSLDASYHDDVLKYINQVLMDDNMEETCMLDDDVFALHAVEKPFYDLLVNNYPPPNHSWDPTNDFGGNSISSSSGSTNFAEPNQIPPTCLSVFSDDEYKIMFQKGVEEANKFLPKNNNLAINLENMTSLNEVRTKKDEHGSRAGKVHYREDDEDFDDGRNIKQSAFTMEEVELSEMFDRVLIMPSDKHEAHCTMGLDSEESRLEVDRQKGKRFKIRPSKPSDGKNDVDLMTLLILCAQSTSSYNYETANELLKQIKEHSSAVGNGSQRLAHFFAHALEARLAGTSSAIYTTLNSKKTTATDMIKVYQFSIRICPFEKMCIGFANHNILRMAEKTSKLHVIDFGISYGFQWPILIQRLSERPGGPPKLRITGIDIPQPGCRPTIRVEATGCLLTKYCERFKVVFEYRAIAKKWEKIKVDELMIESDEMVVVNCLHSFKNILDETVVSDSPRNAVLNSIKKLKPHVFLHGIVNGSYNSPFFMNRFRDALFHYSALFDMFESNARRDDPERLFFEDLYGKEIMNVVACEGIERGERPETYKQWQVRSSREGLRQLPLDPELVKKLGLKVKANYNRNFVLDVDGDWMLMGWKGRLTNAISAWVPS